MDSFQEKMSKFSKTINDLSNNNSIPKWFKPFVESFKGFSNDVACYFHETEEKLKLLESQLAIQKSVTDNLVEDRSRLNKTIEDLEDELDDQQQYSRRNCLLIHGVEEKQNENVEAAVMDIVDNKLKATVLKNDISRMHRLGRRKQGRPRPIIVRFISYRQRKNIFDVKKRLKGQGILITENLTSKRYSLLRKCIEQHGRENCWTLDGRIYFKVGETVKIVTKKADLER